MVTELAFDLQPAGWRLTGSPGIDHRRAASLLAQDLDTTEELAAGPGGAVQDPGRRAMDAGRDRRATARRQGAGRPRRPTRPGPGARRGGARALRRRPAAARPDASWSSRSTSPRCPRCWPVPSRPRAGSIATARSTPADAAQALTWVAEAAADAGAPSRSCTAARADLPFDVLRSTPISGGLVRPLAARERPVRRPGPLARRWAGRPGSGVVPADRAGRSARRPMRTSPRRVLSLVARPRLHRPRDAAGHDRHTDVWVGRRVAGWAQTALALCQRAARNLSVEQGKMDP